MKLNNDNRGLIIFLILSLLTVPAGWILYQTIGRDFVASHYEGQELPVRYYLELADSNFYRVLIALPLFLAILFFIAKPKVVTRWLIEENRLNAHTDAIDAIPASQLGIWVAVAAGIGLFMELMLIRIHSSYFQLFAYFKNVSLLSCFLGLGIGYARGSVRPLMTPLVLPLIAVQIIFMYILRYSPLAVFLQNPITEQLALGMEQTREISHTVIVYGFLSLIFVFNALCFIPLGQLVSRLMMRGRKLISYSWNLAGSLAGILLFCLTSYLWTPPVVWIVLSGAILMLFLYKDNISILQSAIALLAVLFFLLKPFNPNEVDLYSPYQILTLSYHSKKSPVMIEASNAYHQRIYDLSEENIRCDDHLKKISEYYNLPYYFKAEPDNVLIVGSGTGNDVAAAVRNRAGNIDAVEIDPVILRLGKLLHPEHPYLSGNVNAVVNDARAHIEHTNKRYDLIVYGLLDSHTLLSGISGGIRLDSYVYTVEGIRKSRSKLQDDGIICLTFSLLSDAMGRKLFLMLKEAFGGKDPVVYHSEYDGGYTFLAGNKIETLAIPDNAFSSKLVNTFADSSIKADISTDNWPFFYMPVKRYPLSLIAMVILLIIISGVFIRIFIPDSGSSFSFPCFFLGAGFMLVETKGITELALVYGSTWFVISAVIAAILIMAFFANFLVIKKGTPPLAVTYGALFISLMVGLGLTFLNIGDFSPWVGRALMTSGLTLPLFFSGFAFSSELNRSSAVSVALYSNLLGAILGGFLEYNSMYWGFRSLYFIALVMYGLAFLWSFRRN